MSTLSIDPKGVEVTAGTYPVDSDISSRNRPFRFLVLAIYLGGVLALGFLLGLGLSTLIFDGALAGWLGAIFGTGLGALTVLATVERLFIIRNNTTSVFVTIDQLRTLLGAPDVYVVYGAGTHISLPWEKRLEENNISLEEVGTELRFEFQCKDGVITGVGSYRLRADPKRLIPFLLGVASVAGEIQDLISKKSGEYFYKSKVLNAVQELKKLNAYLEEELVKGDETSDIERRFGMQLTDVTIKQLLPSKELQRAVTAQAEAETVQRGTRMLLNCSSKKDLDEKLASGRLTISDVNFARDRFLSMSGNLEGVNINRNEVDVKIEGLDPEAMQALSDLARSPAALAAATKVGKSSKGGDNK